MILWAAVDTRDKYKRLCAVADTPQELAKMMHVKPSSIQEAVSRAKKGLIQEKYLRIEIPDDMDAFTDTLWNSLNEENKVSLFVRYIDIATGKYETKIVNKNK